MGKITMAATAFIALLASTGSTLAAPAVSDDDVRCFLLSNAFAKSATDPKARATAAATLTFYLGRLDGRASPAVIAATIKRVGPTIDPKAAGPQMGACAQRMGQSEQTIQAAVKLLTPAAK
jgi:hypothetical protein